MTAALLILLCFAFLVGTVCGYAQADDEPVSGIAVFAVIVILIGSIGAWLVGA